MINRINSIFRRNLPAKILALCVAVILWVVVMNDQNPAIEGSFNVPLAVVNSPEGYKITKSEDSVKIKVRGPRSLFVTATADDFRAYVDLDGAQDGKQDCKVQTALPQGFELVEVAADGFLRDLIVGSKLADQNALFGAEFLQNFVFAYKVHRGHS